MGPPDLDRLRGELIVQYGLREIRAMTDDEVITVSEPSMWDDAPIERGDPDYGLKVEIRRAEV